MSQAVYYLFSRLFLAVREFFEHWYIRSFVHVSHFMLNLFEELDKSFALKVNLRNLFKPLYQDRTFIGYIFGFTFRSFRIAIALVVYGVIFFISVLLYLAWLVLPLFFIYKAFSTYGE